MPVDLTVRIVLTGLISVVAHDGAEYGLVLNAQNHQAVLLLAEGECVDRDDCEVTYLKPHFWPLWRSDDESDAVPISLDLGTRPSKPSRRRIVGDRPPMPDEHVYLAPVEWSASLCEAFDPNNSEEQCALFEKKVEAEHGWLPTTCVEERDCGLTAILTIPGGAISACHFNHIRSYLRPPPESVACSEKWPSSARIQSTHLMYSKLGESTERAVADSLLVEVVVRRDRRGRPVELRIGDNTVKITGTQTGGATERITLLLMNEEQADFCDLLCDRCVGKCGVSDSEECRVCRNGCECRDVAADEHQHFQHYYHALGLDSGPRLVMYPEGETWWADAGACEMLFVCMEAKGHYRLDEMYRGRAEAAWQREVVFRMPHSPSQCDVSTYP